MCLQDWPGTEESEPMGESLHVREGDTTLLLYWESSYVVPWVYSTCPAKCVSVCFPLSVKGPVTVCVYASSSPHSKGIHCPLLQIHIRSEIAGTGDMCPSSLAVHFPVGWDGWASRTNITNICCICPLDIMCSVCILFYVFHSTCIGLVAREELIPSLMNLSNPIPPSIGKEVIWYE